MHFMRATCRWLIALHRHVNVNDCWYLLYSSEVLEGDTQNCSPEHFKCIIGGEQSRAMIAVWISWHCKDMVWYVVHSLCFPVCFSSMPITHAEIYNAVNGNQLNAAWREKETAFGNYQTILETSFLLNTNNLCRSLCKKIRVQVYSRSDSKLVSKFY